MSTQVDELIDILRHSIRTGRMTPVIRAKIESLLVVVPQYEVTIKKIQNPITIDYYSLNLNGHDICASHNLEISKKEAITYLQNVSKALGLAPVAIEQITFKKI